VGDVKLPLAFAELGLIDEYELFAGLSKRVDLSS
jgi:hypothetical protein